NPLMAGSFANNHDICLSPRNENLGTLFPGHEPSANLEANYRIELWRHGSLLRKDQVRYCNDRRVRPIGRSARPESCLRMQLPSSFSGISKIQDFIVGRAITGAFTRDV